MPAKFIFDLDNTLYDPNLKLSNQRYNPKFNKLLKELQGKKYIFSNNTSTNGSKILKHLKVKSIFHKATYINNFHIPKPHMHAFTFAIKYFNIKQNDTVIFFDDNLANLLTAKKYDWITVYVGTQFKNISYPSIDFAFENIMHALQHKYI
jgi:FMN phosphatase YigB (HAD superfamily)